MQASKTTTNRFKPVLGFAWCCDIYSLRAHRLEVASFVKEQYTRYSYFFFYQKHDYIKTTNTSSLVVFGNQSMFMYYLPDSIKLGADEWAT